MFIKSVMLSNHLITILYCIPETFSRGESSCYLFFLQWKKTSPEGCIEYFLVLLKNLSSHGSGGQKFEIQVLAESCSLQKLQGRILPCLFLFPVPPGFPWLVAASLHPVPLSSHGSPLCVSLPCVSFVRTLDVGFRAHQANPECSYPMSLTLITSK